MDPWAGPGSRNGIWRLGGGADAVDKGAAWVHRLLILVVILSAAYLLGVFEWIGRLIGL